MPITHKPGDTVRLNLELDLATKMRLDKCRRMSGSASLTETIRRALRLYEMVLDAGGELTIDGLEVRVL